MGRIRHMAWAACRQLCHISSRKTWVMDSQEQNSAHRSSGGLNLGPTDLGSLQSPKLVRAAAAPAHLVSSLATCPLQPQLPRRHCFCPWPGGSLRLACYWVGILWDPGACLSLCVLRQGLAQPKIQIGCILARQSQDTSHCKWKPDYPVG